ncbi:dihydrolipoyl dehydrogenase [Staphylococcus saccharolyticus]|uniref:Dihydrolipoyl dehydrogenase n=1 Tax=Staphylococcus saccharolyticus TaxID=33028 RepID=A0A380H5C1_9STAP|nr:dihydrolipoyl dehydrogenase [Staphylococcus saccharolyticus]MBL7565209.1 dihydrolipoyl dehydrogenase [Staphylococcus saccharolyticus]MBL7571754.1 dihydrolipoyl dehydrogenase [Staphylococcus saccharolyticus]QQB98242.1 dihydrolipoyl dehydrogenase [Staphylococcus saccharolyticus]QRJ65904.1 dihydrolipoyl dehydrogenase [Staphylococcus saccharolyticus]RTX96469.1 dihydrolipoyl dehydrogenase [Staphylococcus saccharolyticus]
MSEKQYDLVVLGGGTAGYVAAIRASQLGKKVAIVEKSLLGGTCLHKGCIPTKALLKSAEVHQTIKNASNFGFDVRDFKINFDKILQRKDEIVKQMHKGVNHLMQSNHIDIFNGIGRILGTSIFSPQSGTISVEYENGESDLIPNQFVLIATGSRPKSLSFINFDHDKILSSDDILSLNSLPQSLAIIGGGVIGLEFASLMTDLGTSVTVIEANERIIPSESKQIATILKRELSSRGVRFYEDIELDENSIQKSDDGVTIHFGDQLVEIEKVLISIGRQANTNDIGLNNTKIKTDEAGHIITNTFQQTEDKHIYAAGDCIGKLQLAHVGSKEGIVAVEHMFEETPIPLNYDLMPKCIYTYPEVASIGKSLEQAKIANINARSYKVSFKAIGKALIDDMTEQKGFCEMIINQDTDEIIGLNMIGPHVTELINEISLLQFMNGSSLELGLTTHAHPSLSEVLMELGLKAEGRAIHI